MKIVSAEEMRSIDRATSERFERTDRAEVEAALRRHLDVATLAVVTGLPASNGS